MGCGKSGAAMMGSIGSAGFHCRRESTFTKDKARRTTVLAGLSAVRTLLASAPRSIDFGAVGVAPNELSVPARPLRTPRNDEAFVESLLPATELVERVVPTLEKLKPESPGAPVAAFRIRAPPGSGCGVLYPAPLGPEEVVLVVPPVPVVPPAVEPSSHHAIRIVTMSMRTASTIAVTSQPPAAPASSNTISITTASRITTTARRNAKGWSHAGTGPRSPPRGPPPEEVPPLVPVLPELPLAGG